MSVMRNTNSKARCALKRRTVLLITCGVDTNVRFSQADDFFKAMAQAMADNSADRTFRSFLSPDLPILDDLELRRLTSQQCAVHTL